MYYGHYICKQDLCICIYTIFLGSILLTVVKLCTYLKKLCILSQMYLVVQYVTACSKGSNCKRLGFKLLPLN